MALSEAEFGKAIEGFATLVRRALLVSDDGDDGRLKGEWEDVEIVEKVGCGYSQSDTLSLIRSGLS